VSADFTWAIHADEITLLGKKFPQSASQQVTGISFFFQMNQAQSLV
jgi:hypothetical protein